MRFDDLLAGAPSWANTEGESSEIVLSSRVRFARNLQQFKFPDRANEKEVEEIFDFIRYHIRPLQREIFRLSMLSALDRKFLVERHLISKELLKNFNGKGVGLWEGESLSVIVNEEDHLRIQYIAGGLNLELAYRKLNEVDHSFSSLLPYAFSSKFGYLTACPTNTGTGLRASVVVHLPGLVHSGKIRKVLEKLSQIGLLARGFYGEGTKVEGNFFHVSNQTTLGRKEEEIVDRLHKTILQVVEYENNARELLLKNARAQIENQIWRAYSILKSTRLLSTEEFINLSSAIRFGIGLGILKEVKLCNLNKLLIFVQPAHLQKIMGKMEDPSERDAQRAMYVRENL